VERVLARLRRSSVRSLQLATLLVVLAALVVPSAAGAALTWSSTRTPVETGAGLTAIACPSLGLCVAGGPGDRLAVSTGPAAGTWTAFTAATGTPGTIADISCATAALCVAVDSAGNVLSSTDPGGGAGAWHAAHFTRPASVSSMSFSSVSCPTETRCVAVDTADNALLSTSAPTAPQAGWNLDQLAYTPRQVSCTTVVCVAVTGSYVFTTSAAGTGGGAWTRTTLEGGEGTDGKGRPTSISCTPLVCVAGGDGGINGTEAFSSTDPAGGAAAWRHTPLSGSNLDDANCVSAVATTLCTLSTDFGGFVFDSLEPNGGTAAWALSPSVGGSEHVADVACPTTSLCFAVTAAGYAVLGTGPAASPSPPSPSPPSGSADAPADPGTAPAVGGPGAANPLPDAPGPFTGVHFPAGTTTISHTSNAVSFMLESSVAVSGTLTGSTVGSYAFALAAGARSSAHPLSLGAVKFSLQPKQPKRVTLKLPPKVRTLLKKRGALPVRLTISSTDGSGGKSSVSRRYTLTTAKPRH
jgi:hypothetical protein